MTTNKQRIDTLVADGVLQTERIIEAFKTIERIHFILQKDNPSCYDDRPLDIGFGQTISQPTTVAFMFELLDPQPGENIMDVGSGSGWTTALLAQIVGPSGNVYGVERIPELVECGTINLSKFDFPNASIVAAGDTYGILDKAPFDKILVSAAGEELPNELVDQLKPGGILVMPVQEAVWKVQKQKDGKLIIDKHHGFIFVPLMK